MLVGDFYFRFRCSLGLLHLGRILYLYFAEHGHYIILVLPQHAFELWGELHVTVADQEPIPQQAAVDDIRPVPGDLCHKVGIGPRSV